MFLQPHQLELIGLKPSEKKILLAVEKIGKNVAQISRLTEIPRTSLLYMLKKLKEKKLITSKIIGKRTYWKTNIQKQKPLSRPLLDETILINDELDS